MPTDSPQLRDFLLARIAEDEASYGAHDGSWDQSADLNEGYIAALHDRLRDECDAKRQSILRLTADTSRSDTAPLVRTMLAFAALPYADHPDYRQEWRP